MSDPKSDSAEMAVEQICYTWSVNGLGRMNVGYRVRAVSPGLRDLQSARFAHIDSYLRYRQPDGVATSEAPVCLSLAYNGYERILVRKVYRGVDLSNRPSVYFSHLLAGLPDDFTARHAIRLWHCPQLWRETDDDFDSRKVDLEALPYSKLRELVDTSSATFDFTPLWEQLVFTIQVFLAQGVPHHFYVFGHSDRIAALLWGLTHSLPLAMLRDLTFSTYEYDIAKYEAVFVGTLMANDLPATYYNEGYLTVNVDTGRCSPFKTNEELEKYARYAAECLLRRNTFELDSLVAEADKREIASTEEFINLYKRRIVREPLNERQLTTILRQPEHEVETLGEPFVQRECARILVENQDYWNKTGKDKINNLWYIVDELRQKRKNNSLAVAITNFMEEVGKSVADYMEAFIIQDNDDMILHCRDIMITLAPVQRIQNVWLYVLAKYPQNKSAWSQINRKWNIQEWVLRAAGSIQPLPPDESINLWLTVSSWEKLSKLLALPLPENWQKSSVFWLLRQYDAGELPKEAVTVIARYQPVVLNTLVSILQSTPHYTELVIHCFQSLVNHDYKARSSLLISLLNAVKNDSQLIDRFVSVVAFFSPTQLNAIEIDDVLEQCDMEVLICGIDGTAPHLARYLAEYFNNLDLRKVQSPRTQNLLQRFSERRSMSGNPLVINGWMTVAQFLQRSVAKAALDKEELQKLAMTLGVFTSLPNTSGQSRLSIDELLPILMSRIRTESDIIRVVDILGPSLSLSELELLQRMARIIGQSYGQKYTLADVAIYISCGIGEFLRLQQIAGISPFLDTLLEHVSTKEQTQLHNAGQVLWPGEILEGWQNWWNDKVKASMPRFPSIPSIGSAIWSSYAVSKQPAFTAPIPPVASPSQIPETKPPVEYAVKLDNTIVVPYEYYKKMHFMLREGLPYRLNYLRRQNAYDWIQEEIDLSERLLGEVSDRYRSEILAKYLLDDAFLRTEIKHLIETDKNFAQFYDPEQDIHSIIRDFEASIGEKYMKLRGSYTEGDIRKMLLTFIRRDKLHLYLNQDKGWLRKKQTLARWLEQKQKGRKIGYFGQ